jgi:ubiquinone/menaquinone biosynthesis C-methylase UbiE
MRDYAAEYQRFADNLTGRYGERAADAAIGGSFDQIGYMERQSLIQWGLAPHHRLADVGCGVGRLATHLQDYLHPGCYLGIDIVPSFLEQARSLCPGYEFALSHGLTVPAPDESFNMVCAFSLFTHLEHQHTYVYLQDIRRVLIPGGRLIFSFLSFACPSHWPVFLQTITALKENPVLNQFTEPAMWDKFAEALQFEQIALQAGSERHIPLDREVTMPNGAVYKEWGTIGQSIAVWQKPI